MPTRPLQTATQSRPHTGTILQMVPQFKLHNDMLLTDGDAVQATSRNSYAHGTTFQATHKHAPYRWRRNWGHKLTCPLQMAPQSGPQTDTSIADGAAVNATNRQAINRWSHSRRPLWMAPQSKPHTDAFVADGSAVQAIHRHAPSR
jgi:uncharacterized Zn-binding protein involved in type VI secretion